MANDTAKKVAVIMGSDSDLPTVKPAIDKLKSFGVEVEAHVMSAHRTPAQASEFAANAKANGFGVIIAAAGKAKLIGREHTSAGQVLIDVGINFLDGKLCGDFDYESTSRQAAAATPVPGGVGAVTTSVLLKHTVDSAGKLC